MMKQNKSRNIIFIKDLHASCTIGVRPEEREQPQDIFISIELYCDSLKGRITDNLDDTVDYSALSKRISAAAESSHYILIEALAEEIGRICIEDSRVMEAVVRVEKPGAVPAARTVGIEITTTKEKEQKNES